MEPKKRTVTLRDERPSNGVWRTLRAYLDENRLRIEGHDLGKGVSHDGEYEWFERYAAEQLPSIVALLDGHAGEDVLDVLERWVGRSYELEKRLQDSKISHELEVYY